jgi:hypothetical protein
MSGLQERRHFASKEKTARRFSEPLNAHSVVHEQRRNENERKWDTNQPKQSASTKAHDDLHSTCLLNPGKFGGFPAVESP